MKHSRELQSCVLVSLFLVFAGCGEDGTNGPIGDPGLRGTDGTLGPTGTKGMDGEEGTDGTNGTNGTNGEVGDPGEDGTDGDDGLDGEDGIDGDDGEDGIDGDDGDAGPQGEQGETGATGESGIIDRAKLTGDFKLYNLDVQNSSGISGVVRFAKFIDGSTLVSVRVMGTVAGIHPSHIHVNSIAHGQQPAAVTLNSVDGITGIGETIVRELGDGTPITYDQLIVFNGYVNVHTSPMVGTPVCGGDIGGNALTGTNKVYPLTQLAASGVSGTATLAERVNGFALLTISVSPTVVGTDHPAHIHTGAASSGGAAIINLTNVSGSTGISRTDIRALNDASAITYAQLLVLNAYVNVHTSVAVGTPIAEGNFGSNAP